MNSASVENFPPALVHVVVDGARRTATIQRSHPADTGVSMIGVKATVLPFFEFLAPHKAGQPLYLVPERAAVLCLAEVIIARDRDTGEEKPVWGTDESERLEAGEDLQCGPVLVVELSFANELESLIDLVTAVRCVNDAEDGAEDDNEVDDAEDASDLED